MTTTNRRSVVHYAGIMAIAAVIALAGCQRKSESAATVSPAAAPVADSQVAPAAGSLKVTVSLSPELTGKAVPNDVVFVFARAANGPRMPLAVVRKQVKDLPATIVLDDRSAMSPEMKLSGVPEVIVVARVSKSGEATPQPGDLEGVSAPVKTGQALTVSIAHVVGAR